MSTGVRVAGRRIAIGKNVDVQTVLQALLTSMMSRVVIKGDYDNIALIGIW